MTVEAYAKVNLTLEVYGKRPDGYHALRSIVQPITLADTLEIELTQDGSVASDTGYGEKDLIVRAARCFLSSHAAGVPRPRCGCRVRVTKRIPAGGGLGGGSADAAATLRALNELGRFGKSPEELAEIGASVGSDVPALVLAQHYRRPVLMEGRGERVSLIPSTLNLQLSPSNSQLSTPNFQLSTLNFQLSTFHLVLANPGVFSSTPEVFAHCTPRASDSGDAALLPRENEGAIRLFNDLESPAIALHPEIGAALEALRSVGATDVMMTGSGATVFGFAKDAFAAERSVREMISRGYRAWSCATLAICEERSDG